MPLAGMSLEESDPNVGAANGFTIYGANRCLIVAAKYVTTCIFHTYNVLYTYHIIHIYIYYIHEPHHTHIHILYFTFVYYSSYNAKCD